MLALLAARTFLGSVGELTAASADVPGVVIGARATSGKLEVGADISAIAHFDASADATRGGRGA